MDCIPYINDLLLEINILKDIDNGDENISNLIKEKETLIEKCKNNLTKLSKYKIEYRLYLYILNGLTPTQAVKKIADENYKNDVKPKEVSSIWRKYKKISKILSKC